MRSLLFVILAWWSFCRADPVIAVTDGDTISVLSSTGPVRVRLANIDAPEKKQAFGMSSKKSLSEICFGHDAALDVVGKDRYGRLIAVVFCDGANANEIQIRRGMAWVYRKYNRDPYLVELETIARNSEIGLWSDPNAVSPWEFRKSLKINCRRYVN